MTQVRMVQTTLLRDKAKGFYGRVRTRHHATSPPAGCATRHVGAGCSGVSGICGRRGVQIWLVLRYHELNFSSNYRFNALFWEMHLGAPRWTGFGHGGRLNVELPVVLTYHDFFH